MVVQNVVKLNVRPKTKTKNKKHISREQMMSVIQGENSNDE